MGGSGLRWTHRSNASVRDHVCASVRLRLRIWKWRLLLPGASEPRLKLLRPQDFSSVFLAALRSKGNRSIVVVCNYEVGPITAEPCRAKARPLLPRRSYFAPISGISNQVSEIRSHANRYLMPDYRLLDGGGAGYCPRVRRVYCDGHLSP